MKIQKKKLAALPKLKLIKYKCLLLASFIFNLKNFEDQIYCPDTFDISQYISTLFPLFELIKSKE